MKRVIKRVMKRVMDRLSGSRLRDSRLNENVAVYAAMVKSGLKRQRGIVLPLLSLGIRLRNVLRSRPPIQEVVQLRARSAGRRNA